MLTEVPLNEGCTTTGGVIDIFLDDSDSSYWFGKGSVLRKVSANETDTCIEGINDLVRNIIKRQDGGFWVVFQL